MRATAGFRALRRDHRLPRFPRRSRNGSSSASLAGSAPDRPGGGPHRGLPGAAWEVGP